MKLSEKVRIISKNNTTYRTGLLQAKAFRILQQCTAEYLKPYKISPILWAFIGLIGDNPEGIQPSDAAKELGVEAPFITSMLKELRTGGLVNVESHKKDSRGKVAILTPKGKKMVKIVEKTLRKKMRSLIKGISYGELLAYLKVLTTVIENSDSK